MWIVRLALRRPYTFVVMALLIAILGGISLTTMPVDIFPYIDLPVVAIVFSILFIVYSRNTGEDRLEEYLPFIFAGGAFLLGIPVYLAQRTRMTEPQRAARLWLAVAVATWWLLSVGGAAEETIPEGTRLDVSAALACQRWQHRATCLRLVSIFRRGWILILVALLNQAPLPLGAFSPEPWPTSQTRDETVIRPYAGVHHDVGA